MNLEQKIDLYLTGQMSAQELTAFESEIAADSAMEKEVEFQRLAQQALRIKGEFDVKSMLQKHESERKSAFSSSKLFAIVAVFIAGLTLYYFYQRSPPQSEEVIMAQYFIPYKSPTILRGDEQVGTAWALGVSAYADGDYQRAAQEFSSITSDEVAPLYLVKFYHAIALLASDQSNPATAIKLLSDVAQGQHDYVQQSSWYLALAYLQADLRTEAIRVLNEIVVQNHYKYVEAEQLLDELQLIEARQ